MGTQMYKSNISIEPLMVHGITISGSNLSLGLSGVYFVISRAEGSLTHRNDIARNCLRFFLI